MDRFLLNSESEKKEGTPSNSDKSVKKRKYRKYYDKYLDFGFTSTEVNGEERLQCVLCMKVLVPECMLSSKLKCHLETNHPSMVSKSRDYFTKSEISTSISDLTKTNNEKISDLETKITRGATDLSEIQKTIAHHIKAITATYDEMNKKDTVMK